MKEFNKRYKNFRNCYLPCPNYDKDKNIFSWVNYINEMVNVNDWLLDAMGDVIKVSLVYRYSVGENICHAHNFDDVIKVLYKYPESFIIPNDYLDDYSRQEYNYLMQIKNYLILVGIKNYNKSIELEELDNKWLVISEKKHKNLKDKIFLSRYQKLYDKIVFKENIKRCNNSKAKEYSKYGVLYYNDEELKRLLNKKYDYKIYVYHSFSRFKLNNKYLIVNNNNYVGILKVIEEKIIKFRDLDSSMINNNYSFTEYKNELLKSFQEKSKNYNEYFNDESLISCVKLELIDKF